MNPDMNFRDFIRACETRRARVGHAMRKALTDVGAFALRHKHGRLVIVTPSLRNQGLFQITSIGRDGEAWGHYDCAADNLEQEMPLLGYRQVTD